MKLTRFWSGVLFLACTLVDTNLVCAQQVEDHSHLNIPIPTENWVTRVSDDYQTKTHLRLPFDGLWFVLWGGRRIDLRYQSPTSGFPIRIAASLLFDVSVP